MLCFAAATAFAVPNIWRDGMGKFNLYILITGLVTAAWFGGRAWFSPVEEMAWIDLSLVCMAASTFIVLQNAFRSNHAQTVIITGIALLLFGNLVVIAVQTQDISYSFLIPHPTRVWPSGFSRHYSHGAAFLISSSLLLAGFSLRGSWPLIPRIGLFLLALLGIAAVFITKSRSGMIGASAGVVTLLIYWLFTCKRDDRKWSGVALILAPIILIGIAAFSLSTLETIQQTRREGSGLLEMMDNYMRLYLYGIAFSCIALHPIMGGGSRSFSWENYQFWNIEDMGALAADPEHVHNEFVQVFTDYGIIGAGLLIAFIIGIWILCTFRSFVQGEHTKYAHADAWRIGGIAAFIGIFIQSNFEGTLRTAPGAIILAICLAAASHGRVNGLTQSIKQAWLRRAPLTTLSLVLVCLLGFYGWKGSMVSKDLWTAVFSKNPQSTETKIQAYSAALAHWELESLLSQRGILYFELAKQKTDKQNLTKLLEKAILDFKKAETLHPFTPLHPRNAAITLSCLKKNDEAAIYYEKAIRLQGGMEAAFKSRLEYAKHLYLAGRIKLFTGSSRIAIDHFTRALELFDALPAYVHGAPKYTLQKNLTLYLARALEDQEEYQLALEKYDLANQIVADPNSRYLAGFMLMKIGEKALSDGRPADALRLFLEAQTRLNQSALSSIISPEARDVILADLKKRIVSLEQEKHLPSEVIRFK